MTTVADRSKTLYSLRANIPTELEERLRKIAEKEEDTLSHLVLRAVRAYVVVYEQRQR
jgi:hypothetical protein